NATNLVVDRDPTHVLASGPDATPEPEAERQQHARQHSALAPEDDAASYSHDADACVGRGRSRRFPLHADAGDEIVSRRALFVERLSTAFAVVPDRRGRDEHRRGTREAPERAREQARSLRARLEDQALAGVGPPLVADPGSSKMDDAADPL